jgi:hypothetical protein
MNNREFKIAANKNYCGWDFTMDGRYEEPRIKGEDKKRRSKLRRTIEKRELKKEDLND